MPTERKPSSNSNTLLTLSLLSFVTCCLPIGLMSAALGIRDLLRSKAVGVPIGAKTIWAIVLGVLSALDGGGVYLAYRHDIGQKNAQASSALARTSEAGRGATVLSEQTACALAEALVLQRKATKPLPVKCGGPLEAGPAFATLRGVTLELAPPKTFTVCLAKRGRWFATAALHAGRCPEALPAAPEGLAADAAERDTQEKVEAMVPQLELEGLVELLKKSAAAFAELAEPRSVCPELSEGSAAVFDLELLPGSSAVKVPDASWSFLTSEPLWKAFDLRGSVRDRQDSAREALALTRPFLLLLSSTERRAPMLTGHGFARGFLSSRLALVDTASGEVVCEAPLEFQSSETVKTGGGVRVGLRIGPMVNVGGTELAEAIEEDFHASYRAALDATLQSMTKGRVTAK